MNINLTIKRDYHEVITYTGEDIKMAEAFVALAKTNPQPDKGEI